MIKRRRLSQTQRVALFLKEGGICHLCKMKITEGQEWDHSHEIPLEAGGEDNDENSRVAHRRCHRKHTAEVDIPIIAKVKRIHAKRIGAKPPSRNPIPGGRRSKYKRKVGGGTVLRDPE